VRDPSAVTAGVRNFFGAARGGGGCVRRDQLGVRCARVYALRS